MTTRERMLQAFANWYKSLPKYRGSGGPARGTIGAALVVLERLQENYDLDLNSHRAAGKSQFTGVSGSSVARILAKHGETRRFIAEGGRTNRGAARDISTMLDTLKAAKLECLSVDERNQILKDLQRFLVDEVRAYHSRQRLKVSYDPSKSAWQSIHELLTLARENGKEGPVAQYLVGAKLQLRFPDIQISNESYSTADDQLGRPGDFFIGDTAFHVTVAPMPAVYEKCKRNIEEGMRTYLLVPDRCLIGARQNAEATAPGRINVESIESFVGNNLEELSIFSKNRLINGFYRLLETYNQRVDAIESDKSMLIEIPKSLQLPSSNE